MIDATKILQLAKLNQQVLAVLENLATSDQIVDIKIGSSKGDRSIVFPGQSAGETTAEDALVQSLIKILTEYGNSIDRQLRREVDRLCR